MPPLERQPSTCACGRQLDAAATSVYRSPTRRTVYRRCACGREWTESDHPVAIGDPISTDELLELHASLQREDWSLGELLKPWSGL